MDEFESDGNIEDIVAKIFGDGNEEQAEDYVYEIDMNEESNDDDDDTDEESEGIVYEIEMDEEIEEDMDESYDQENEGYLEEGKKSAKAKGMGQMGILFLHALKNAAVPVVTVIGIGIALLIGGAVVTESVFAIPGLGRLTIDAIVRRDYPLIQGLVVVFSFVYVLVNLLVDVIYTVIDPRIRY
jgi:hypothetical protein